MAESEGEAAADEKVELVVTEEDLRLARKKIRPSALKEVQFEVPKVAASSSLVLCCYSPQPHSLPCSFRDSYLGKDEDERISLHAS